MPANIKVNLSTEYSLLKWGIYANIKFGTDKRYTRFEVGGIKTEI